MINIDELIKTEMKSGDKSALETYKLVKTKITEFKTQKNAPEYTEAVEIGILQKMVKERRETAQIYRDNQREDLATREETEAKVIEKLLPKPVTEEDITKYVLENYPSGIDKKQMGLVIKEIKNALVGADGGLVSRIVREYLVQ